MKVFKHSISTCKVLLCASLIVNICFILLMYKYETNSQMLRHRLEYVGIIEKKTTSFIDRPDYWCVKGWNTTVNQLNYKCDVMFFGHSQIQQSNFQKYFPNVNIITSGYPGDNVEGMMMRVEQIEALKPTKLFLMCGVNSLGFPDEEFKSKYDLLIREIQKASPQSKLYIFNILPKCDGIKGKASDNNKIVERNNFIKQYCQQKNIKLIDLYSLYVSKDGTLCKNLTVDGVHLTPNAYDIWAKVIKPYI